MDKKQFEDLKQRFAGGAEQMQGKNSETLYTLRKEFLDREDSLVSGLMRQMKSVSSAEKADFGKEMNALRDWMLEKLTAFEKQAREAELNHRYEIEKIDVTLPGIEIPRGNLYLDALVRNQMIEAFTGVGFEIYEDTETETDYYSFTALNTPKDHPARDMQDTFYLSGKFLLRAQTSTGQIHVMGKQKPPIKIFSPDKVFRSDDDATHSPMFTQMEGLVVDKGIALCDLQGMPDKLIEKFFGAGVKTHLRPSYFPFTGPSVEIDVSYFSCSGKDCRLCKGTGWIEVLGTGVMNKKVLENCGIDPDVYPGFAFGIGIEHVAVLKHGIGSIKCLSELNLRMLRQINAQGGREMIAPFSWPREYVDIGCTPQEPEERLFSYGFEVENLEKVGARIPRVIMGPVTSYEPIEGTHLHLCGVGCGSEGKFQICCDADNMEAGEKFPTALVDATVCETNREGTETVGTATAQAGKLRDYDSFGMLCSGMKPGLNEDLYPGVGYNGLLVLPDDTTPDADVKPIVGFDDWFFDIATTANRPDCQRIYGIAREVAAVLGKEMKPLPVSYHEEKTEPHTLQIEVEAPQYYPRCEAHVVKGMKIVSSPAWFRRRLSLVSVSAVSNMVDITNYVMLELGQPMHVFDRRDLTGGRIMVRTAKEGEKLVTLNEQELILTENNLLICDGEKPVGLAGIVGGLNSEIKGTTTAVAFEVAKLAHDNVRRSARVLKKRTDANAYFEKGADGYTVELAMRRVLHLTEGFGAGTVTDGCTDRNMDNSVEKHPLTASLARVSSVLGIEVLGEAVCHILANLDMELELKGNALRLRIPAYREDMKSCQDVAEEVIRFYGYEHLVPNFLKSTGVTSGGLNEKRRHELKLKEILAGGDMHRAIHYSFFSPAGLRLFRYPEGSEALCTICILNPTNEELSLMHTILSSSMANTVMQNQRVGNLSGHLFEFAKIFIPRSLPLTDYPEERVHLALAFLGKKESFFTLGGALDLAAESLHVKFRYEASTEPFTHPYQTTAVYVGKVKVGYLGKLVYDIAGELNLHTDAYLAGLDLDTIKSLPHEPVYLMPLPKFPEMQRDLALVMDKVINRKQVVNLTQGRSPLIREVRLFDVYEDVPIPPTKKSLTFTLTFRPGGEAFTPEELDKLTQEILEELEASCGIALRV